MMLYLCKHIPPAPYSSIQLPFSMLNPRTYARFRAVEEQIQQGEWTAAHVSADGREDLPQRTPLALRERSMGDS